jgi:hypothetical protein
MERVFARMWLAAGRAPALGPPGAFIRRDVAGASVLIVRAGDGSIEAFHNVCRHRGPRAPRPRRFRAASVPVSRVDLRARQPPAGAAMDEVAGFDRSFPLRRSPARRGTGTSSSTC